MTTRRQFLLGSAAVAVSAVVSTLVGMKPGEPETLSRAPAFLPKTPRNDLLGSTVIREDAPWSSASNRTRAQSVRSGCARRQTPSGRP